MPRPFKPDWFVLIEQWVPRRMGQTGITLPFVCGALALKRASSSVSVADIRRLLHEVVSRPYSGHVTEVRWCHNIDAPVLTVAEVGLALPFRSTLWSPAGQVSLGFSEDAHSSFGGLDCTDGSSCLDRLVSHAEPHVTKGTFSRVRDVKSGEFTFAAFLPAEIRYIRDTILAPT